MIVDNFVFQRKKTYKKERIDKKYIKSRFLGVYRQHGRWICRTSTHGLEYHGLYKSEYHAARACKFSFFLDYVHFKIVIPILFYTCLLYLNIKMQVVEEGEKKEEKKREETLHPI